MVLLTTTPAFAPVNRIGAPAIVIPNGEMVYEDWLLTVTVRTSNGGAMSFVAVNVESRTLLKTRSVVAPGVGATPPLQFAPVPQVPDVVLTQENVCPRAAGPTA